MRVDYLQEEIDYIEYEIQTKQEYFTYYRDYTAGYDFANMLDLMQKEIELYENLLIIKTAQIEELYRLKTTNI